MKEERKAEFFREKKSVVEIQPSVSDCVDRLRFGLGTNRFELARETLREKRRERLGNSGEACLLYPAKMGTNRYVQLTSKFYSRGSCRTGGNAHNRKRRVFQESAH